MTIFEPEQEQISRERQSRNIAISKPTGFMQNTRAAWEEFRNNDTIGSQRHHRISALDEQIKKVKEITGEDIDNPYETGTPNAFRSNKDVFGDLDTSGRPEWERRYLESMPDFRDPIGFVYSLFEHNDNLTEQQRVAEYHARIDQIRQALSVEQQKELFTKDQIEAALKSQARSLERKNADIGSRSTLAGMAGQFAGAGGAAIVQPEILLTLPFGASARAGLLSRILAETGIGAASEALLQPEVQRQRQELGLASGPERALENILVAGAGAGGLTAGAIGLFGAVGLIKRGGVKAFENIVKRSATPEERALVDAVQNDGDIEAVTPYEQRGAAIDRVVAENSQAATEAVLEGRPMVDEDLAGRQLIIRAMGGDGESVQVFKGSDLDKIEVDADLMQFKSGGDAQGVTDRLAGVKKWEPERAGLSLVYEYGDGRMIIADGHQRLGLARRLSAEGQDVEMPVMILREADGITPEEARARAAFKNIAEGTGSAQDAAKVLRDLGATVEDLNLPPKSALVRDAEGLANLDDLTFGMVINDVISEQFGAIIGRLVEDPRLQPQIAKLLAKVRPANAVEAESVVRQAIEAGVSRETQSSLFGDEEIASSLFLERARVLDRGLKMIRRNIDTFRTLDERGSDIETEGNVLNETANQQRLDLERRLREYITAQANRKGPISDALNEAAREAKESGQYAPAARKFVQTVSRELEPGKVDGNALQGRGAGAEPDLESAQASTGFDGGGRIPDEKTLSDFDDPAGQASQDQALRIADEIKDELEVRDEARQESFQEDVALRQDLDAKVEAGAPVEEIDQHPAVLKAMEAADAIEPTDQKPGFMTPEWRAARDFTIDGEVVTGIDKAVDRFYDAAGRLGWTDEGLEAPANAIKNERRAFIILGPPAAGKSRFANPIARHSGSRIVDSDEIKKTMPEFHGGVGANAVHEESGMIANEVLSRALDEGSNVVIPKVGGTVSSISKLIGTLTDDGYSVNLVNMAVHADEAYRRMIRRFIKTGRLINPAYAHSVGDNPSRTFNALKKDERVSSHAEIDNNRKTPQITDDSSGGLLGAALDETRIARGPDGGSARGDAPESQGGTQTEIGADGKPQALIEGVNPVRDADRLRLRAETPMRGGNQPMDLGMFGSSKDQMDLMDIAVPIGETIDAEGKRVADTITIRDAMAELEEDQNFYEQLKLCDRGGGNVAA